MQTCQQNSFVSFIELFRQHYDAQPDKPAVTFLLDGEQHERTLSYAALLAQARAVAAALADHVSRGERVALLYPAGCDFVAAFLGCLYAGAIAVPMALPKQPEAFQRAGGILNHCGARAILTDATTLPRLQQWLRDTPFPSGEGPEGRNLAAIATDTLAMVGGKCPPPACESHALLQYTSGSTSSPRGVLVTGANLVHNSASLHKATQTDNDSVLVSWLPHYHDMGLILGILQGLYVGARVVLLSPGHFLQRPARWLEAITRYGGTHSTAPNFAYDYCAERVSEEELAHLDLRCWRTAVNGAEPIRPKTLRRFTAVFGPRGFRYETFTLGYGLAETTLVVSSSRLLDKPRAYHVDSRSLGRNRIVQVEAEASGSRELAGSGRIVDGIEAAIVNPVTCRRCEPHEIGEIWIRGDSVGAGYWNEEELTRQTFHARIADTDEGPYLRTGDLGCFMDDDLVVTGRIKDMIIVRGVNYYPQDIEAALTDTHPELRPHLAAAFGIEVEGEERLAIAHEITSETLADAEGAAAAIRAAVSREFDLEVHAVVLLRCGALPKTTSGKVQRAACRDIFAEGGPNIAHVSVLATPPPPVARAVSKEARHASYDDVVHFLTQSIARRIAVRADAIDIDLPLASLGLSSLAAVQLIAETERLLGRRLSPTLPYEYPTIAALAAHLVSTGTDTRDVGVGDAQQSEPIAIIGMGCRFPGAPNVRAYWDLLLNGVDAVGEVPGERWDVDRLYDANPATPGKMHTRWGGFVEGIGEFDAAFFGISPREAAAMDPQQRWLLEVAWEALEDAGLAPDRLRGSRTGTFVGIGPIDYTYLHLLQSDASDAYMATGCTQSIAANRLAYFFDFRGPSMAVDTACSASLVAVHQACRSLQLGECSLALAGGSNAVLTPFTNVVLSQARMLSPTGRCRAFDASADGYVRGEGAGLVVLKRLRDALAEGDTVLGVIRGTAVNHDGRSNGLTAPNAQAQQDVMRQALAAARENAGNVDYIEAHGTGTSLGDPIEFSSIDAVYGRENRDIPASIGSVKTNIGHLETAAGIAGLIKVVLSLQQEVIPAHLHLREINPLVPLAQSVFRIPTQPVLWPQSTRRRLAGVSGFGFGGANAHIVVEEAPVDAFNYAYYEPRGALLLKLSAATESALRALADRYGAAVEDADATLEALCTSANLGRADLPYRACIVVDMEADAGTGHVAASLRKLARSETSPAIVVGRKAAMAPPKVAFLFTGQGSQYPDMGRPLYVAEPIFRDALDQCADILAGCLDQPLFDVMFPNPDGPALLDQTVYTQPALFALEYSLAQLWASWGITPHIVLGHSIGENVAACIAGAYSLEDGLRLVAKRGRLIQSLPDTGAMAAIFAPRARVEEVVAARPDALAVATINGEELVVISGLREAVAEASARLKETGARVVPMAVSHAFHSPLMDPILEKFRAVAEQIQYQPLKTPLVANDGGYVIPAGAMLDAHYWTQHIRKAVHFCAGMRSLEREGYSTFVEIGPANTLISMGRRCVSVEDALWIPSLAESDEAGRGAMAGLGQLYVHGASVDWSAVGTQAGTRRVELPTYPFERKKYWVGREKRTGRSIAESLMGSTAHSGGLTESGRDLANTLYHVVWVAADAQPLHAAQGAWLLVGGPDAIASAVRARLEATGATCFSARASDAFRCTNHCWDVPWHNAGAVGALLDAFGEATEGAPSGIVDLRCLVPEHRNTDPAFTSKRLMHLVQEVAVRKAFASCRIHVVTEGAVAVAGEETDLAQAPLWGFFRAAALEYPANMGKLVDVDGVTEDEAAQIIAAEFCTPDSELMVALRPGRRYVGRLRHFDNLESGTFGGFRSDATYLVTGGFGGLGVKTIEWMINCGARRLLLLGRSVPPARGAWGRLEANRRSGQLIETVKALESMGAAIHWSSVDVADYTTLADCLDAFEREQWPVIRGVFHLAGVLCDRTIANMADEAFDPVFAPKAVGAWNLHEYFTDRDLDCFVLFSSAASMLGAAGQANYAAANAYLDGLAHYRRRRGLPAHSINWGPWSDVGMAAQTERLANAGVAHLSPDEALHALGVVLGQGLPQVGVFRADWGRLRQRLDAGIGASFLCDVASAQEPATPSRELAARVREAAGAERRQVLVAYVQEQVAAVLGVQPGAVDTSADVIALGLDSIMVMDMIRVFQRDLALRLYAREVFDQPTLTDLAAFMAGEMDLMEQTDASGAPPAEGYVKILVANTKTKLRSVRTAQAAKNPPCVFILSSPRSGSTLFRVMLAGHPMLFSPPEMHLLHFNDMRDRSEVITDDFSLGDGLQRAFMELRGIDGAASDALVAGMVAAETPVHEVYRMLQDEARPRLLVDKSPTYAGNLETLRHAEAVFDGAKYLFLVRHPYAVIESYVRNRTGRMFDFGHVDPYALAEDVWSEHNSVTMAFLAEIDPGRHLEVRYEQLVVDPESVMREVAGFLGVPYDVGMLEPYAKGRMTDGIRADARAIGDPNFMTHSTIDPALGEKWREVNLPRPLGRRAQELARKLNYILPNESEIGVEHILMPLQGFQDERV